MKHKAANNILTFIKGEEETIYTPSVKMIFKLVKGQINDIIENKRNVISSKLMDNIVTQARHMDIYGVIAERNGNWEPDDEKISKDTSALVTLFDNIYSEGLYERTPKNPQQNTISSASADDGHHDTVPQDFRPNI